MPKCMAGSGAMSDGALGGSGDGSAIGGAWSSLTCGAGSVSGLISTAAKPVIAARSICLRQV